MELSETTKPKVLITEDDKENQKFLKLFLMKYFQIDQCDSSESFYSRLENERYDIIIMDITINGNKNGLDLTTELKSNPKYSHIPVVCYTAHAFNRDRLNALNAGCDAYISKPCDIHVLLNTLFELLKASGGKSEFSDPPTAACM